MNNFFKRTWAQINLDNLEHNFNIIKSGLQKDTQIIAVVKADAYGHGADVVAKELEGFGAKLFAVSNLEEAISLRNAGVKGGILILGPTPHGWAKTLYENEIEQTVHSLDYAETLNEEARRAGVKLKVHIKLDTGMGRLGFNARQTDFAKLAGRLKRLDGLSVVAAFSHFSHADCALSGAREFTLNQAELFRASCEALKSEFPKLQLHIQNSAGILDYPGLQFDFVRPGIILYGLSPSDEMKSGAELRPVMELKSCVAAVKTVDKGTPIGYGRAYVTNKKTTVATVPIGYADGYPRHLSSKGTMLVKGRRAKVIGNVCMDQLMLDVTGIEGVGVDDEVTVYGRDGGEFYGAQDAARDAGTISYELVCLVNKRVPRVYIKNGAVVKVRDQIIGE